MIYGASGSVGSYAVQLASHFGAMVTGVCSSRNVSMVESLGADFVIDYKKQDITQITERFDIIFDAVGKISKSKLKKVLAKKGRLVSVKMMTKELTDNLHELKLLADSQKIVPIY